MTLRSLPLFDSQCISSGAGAPAQSSRNTAVSSHVCPATYRHIGGAVLPNSREQYGALVPPEFPGCQAPRACLVPSELVRPCAAVWGGPRQLERDAGDGVYTRDSVGSDAVHDRWVPATRACRRPRAAPNRRSISCPTARLRRTRGTHRALTVHRRGNRPSRAHPQSRQRRAAPRSHPRSTR